MPEVQSITDLENPVLWYAGFFRPDKISDGPAGHDCNGDI